MTLKGRCNNNNNNEPAALLCVSVFCLVHRVCNFVPQRDKLRVHVCSAVTLCKVHVRTSPSEAGHSGAEQETILSMSGHMVGILVQ